MNHYQILLTKKEKEYLAFILMKELSNLPRSGIEDDNILKQVKEKKDMIKSLQKKMR